ncbi:MAG: flagellin [Planctomycetota bacterium]|nr:flagellin [Planctomycetota bacterium]
MGRINTNVQSLLAQRVLGTNNRALNTSLERLSTGLRINRGVDDPAGLIASESLRVEQRGINEAIRNIDRADQMVNIAEGGLQEISSLLIEVQGVVASLASRAGLSDEERNAGQLQIDSILQTIDRLASSTNFQGIKLLNGNFDFQLTSIAGGIADVRVGGARYDGASLDVNMLVTASAQQGGLFLSAGGSGLDLSAGSALVLDVAGSLGSRELSFSSGTSLARIRDTINTFTDVTGVEAVVSGTGVLLRSKEYGSNEFVSVRVVNAGGINSTSNGDSGTPARGIYNRLASAFNSNNTTIASTFTNATNAVRDAGQDIRATVNGIQATARGKSVSVRSDTLDLDVELNASTAQALGSVGGSGPSFTIAGGGAQFQIASRVDIGGRVSISIPDVGVNSLGNSSVGYLNSLASGAPRNGVDGDLVAAQKVISTSIRQVSDLRGRLGNFQRNVLGATVRSLNSVSENTAAAQSVIRDADFATETATLTRSQILVSSTINVLSLANQAPQSALSLLG